jgi:DNA-binding transcriptional LysR family regulator
VPQLASRAEAPPYRWEFTEAGREVVVAAPGRVLSTDSAVNIRLARDGLGLTIVYEDQVRDEIARGELVPVLQEFCESFAGYYLYYPQRRHASRCCAHSSSTSDDVGRARPRALRRVESDHRPPSCASGNPDRPRFATIGRRVPGPSTCKRRSGIRGAART